MPQAPAPAPLDSLPAIFRPRDLEARGISRHTLRTMLGRSEIERLGRGLYRRPSARLDEFETIAAVAARVPGAVVCLLTALRVHQIGTQSPRVVWIAIDRKAWPPQLPDLPVRIMRFSSQMMMMMVETRTVGGVPIRITSPARTIVDCFRYRRQIGIDVALEALREGVSSHRVTIAEVMECARHCRAASVIRPYLESVAS